MTESSRRFRLSRWLFLRTLGLILLSAFLSIWVQIDGLVGSHGILPVAPWLESVREALAGDSWALWLEVPTIFHLGASDTALHWACGLGALASVAVVAGLYPRVALFVCWALYLSISTACRTFLSFQWDILLLEVTFVAMLLAPQPAPAALSSMRVLLFKLVFSSGFVKLASGDPTWRNFTALDYHYETQPLPTWIGWYAHQLPPSIQHFSVMATFFLQLVVPFLIFMPRPARLAACGLLAFEQILIALTGNYCFFNVLALALCVLLLDDAVLLRVWPRRFALRDVPEVKPSRPILVFAGVLALFQALVFARTIQSRDSSPLARELLGAIAPFRTINGYGLFAVMTTKRNEIIIEGSNDGVTWSAYELPYQPGDVMKRPGFVAPHQPRVDWQMWFAALGTVRQNGWFQAFVHRLLEGEPEVRALLAKDPFPDQPPKYIRAELFEYHFTDFEERSKTGAWWRRTHVGTYLPARSL